MKRSNRIVRNGICILCMLTALIFLVIEGWLLFAGDWKLFENHTLAAVQASLRVLVTLAAFLLSTWAFVRKERNFVWAGAGFLAASVLSLPFVSNGIGWIFVILSALFLLSERSIWQRIFPE